MLYGSAVGVDFPNPFVANPSYDDQKSACGPGTSVLSFDVEVELAREEGEGLGVVTVQFAGLRIMPEECGGDEGAEEPVEGETPVEEPAPVEGDVPEDDEASPDQEEAQDPEQDGDGDDPKNDAQDPVEDEEKDDNVE